MPPITGHARAVPHVHDADDACRLVSGSKAPLDIHARRDAANMPKTNRGLDARATAVHRHLRHPPRGPVRPGRTADSPTSRRCRRRRAAARESGRSDSAARCAGHRSTSRREREDRGHRRAHEALVDRRACARSVGIGPSVRAASFTTRSPSSGRRPARREPKAEPAVHARRRAGRRRHDAGELAGGEAAQHRDDAVVARDRMKAQRKRDEPESGRREPAPAQIADDRPRARDTRCSSRNRALDVRVVEMVQQLRAHHDVDAADREREARARRAQTMRRRRAARRGEQRDRAVDADRRQRAARLANSRAASARMSASPVPTSSRIMLSRGAMTARELGERGAQAAEPHVRATDVVLRARGERAGRRADRREARRRGAWRASARSRTSRRRGHRSSWA